MSQRVIQFAPSLLSADFANLQAELQRVASADRLHLDVMDGSFVPNLSFGIPVIKALRPHSSLPFDVHLMIEHPERHLEAFREAGADWITVHIETCPHIHRTIQTIRSLGAHPGVSLNPGTSLQAIEAILPDVDQVLLMSVNPGFGGQAFIDRSLDRLQSLRQMIDQLGLETLIEVDGGINLQTLPQVIRAGADVLVAGSAIFGQKDVRDALNKLRALSQELLQQGEEEGASLQ